MLNPALSDLSKHGDLQYLFLVGHIRQGDVGIQYIHTAEMVVDNLTKYLSAQNLVNYWCAVVELVN